MSWWWPSGALSLAPKNGRPQILQALVALFLELPLPDCRHDVPGRPATHRRGKAHEEHFAPLVHGRPGTKRVPQEIETRVGVILGPVAIATVDNLRLVGMSFQLACLQPPFDRLPDELRLGLRCTMD